MPQCQHSFMSHSQVAMHSDVQFADIRLSQQEAFEPYLPLTLNQFTSYIYIDVLCKGTSHHKISRRTG